MPDNATADADLTLSDQEISDAWIYLLGRLLITRQQQVDFDDEGFEWNQLIHRKPGQVDWPNPNLDVAYSEAWVAIDENSFLLVTVPRVPERYYVVEFLDGWGETVANLNDRVYPGHPDGLFAICLEGANVDIPAGAQRVDVPVRTMRVLLRVELGANWDEAVALQHQFKFEIHGNPPLPEIPRTVMFDIEELPGVEAFDSAEAALQEKDSGTNMQQLAANVRTIAHAIGDPSTRDHVDRVVREKAHPDFAVGAAHIGHGTVRNGWVRPAICGNWQDDWLARSAVNYGGIWANVMEEVIYYKGLKDGDGADFDPDQSYTLTFPADQLPAKYAKYFWSVIAVDRVHRRVLPNPFDRFLLNKESKLTYGEDGSLTLYFAPDKPADAPEGNWLPTREKPWSLTFRFYGPKGAVVDGTYFPPPLLRR
jgi:hypothetical protein